MERDYYDEARRLATALEIEGFPDESRRLVEAIEDGFTSTEILMALRHVLEEFLGGGTMPKAETERIVRSLAKAIGEALR